MNKIEKSRLPVRRKRRASTSRGVLSCRLMYQAICTVPISY